MPSCHRFLLLAAFVFLPALAPAAEDWPMWRGPRGDGVSKEQGLPLRWSAFENIAWKAAIPGKGHSSPIVIGDQVYLTTCLEKEQDRLLLCLDRQTGKTLWSQTVVKAPLERKHRLNSHASATPAADERHVYVAFLDSPHMVVACYDHGGKEVWRKIPGEFHSMHGFCSSPILFEDLVIVNGDQDAPAWIVALDRATGAERWRIDRPNRTRSYCTPAIFRAAGKDQMVLCGSKCVASYDPRSGKLYWIIDGPTEQFVASLVHAEGVFFVTGGYPDFHFLGIRPDGSGNVTDTHILWRDSQGASYVPSPIAVGRNFFLVNDNGIASCLDARTGKRHWKERLGRHHSASPVAAGGYLYFPDDDGRTWVVRASEEFEVVARNDLKEECYASPAIARGQIFLRTLENLYCIGKPGGSLLP